MGWLQNSATAASNTAIEGIASTTAAPMSNIDNIVMALAAQGRQWVEDFGGVGEVGGAANAITLTPVGGSISALADGQLFTFVALYTNTDAVTFSVNTYSDGVSKSVGGSEQPLVAGDIKAGNIYTVRYRADWSDFLLIDWNSSIADALTFGLSNLDAALLVTEAEGIADNGTGDTVPTSAAVKDYVDTELASATAPQSIPIAGMILDYAGATAPSGWLFCYGQAIDRTTYVDLFTVIGTTFGSGNGSTTFNLPDLRGRVAAGQDDMGGSSANRLTGQTGGVNGDNFAATGGAEAHVITSAQMPNNVLDSNYQSEFGTGSAQSTAHVSSPAAAAHNNVQPTIILNKIIFTGVAAA